MNFNEKLQKLRKEKGLSQESLAEMLDVSRQAVSKWESGQSYPETEKLIAISDIFGITMDSLIKNGDLQTDSNNNVSIPFWMSRGSVYEYKSKKQLFGLPLVHINLGRGAKKAKGIIAIGNISKGIVSIGLVSMGIISLGVVNVGLIGLGCLTLGLLAIGSFSFGVFAIGAVSVGVITFGAISVGMFSAGACSIATHVAVGDHAYGHIAIGRVVEGVKTFIDTSPERDFSSIDVNEVRKAITTEYPGIWNWIVKFIISWIK